MDENEEIIKDIVIARLKSLPEDTGISVGSEGDFNREELILHVKKGDEVGLKIIEVEMSFLRGLKEGILYAQ
jgi:hypothetical protein